MLNHQLLLLAQQPQNQISELVVWFYEGVFAREEVQLALMANFRDVDLYEAIQE